MKIWLFNNYNMLPEHGALNRHFYFAKNLKKMGHEPVVFVGSHPHNTNLQLVEGRECYRINTEHHFPWVLVRTCNYEGSKIKRVWSMVEYYVHAKKASADFEKPDAIMGSSAHPLAAILAIRLARKYKCRSVVEIRDLWPESIVAYGIAGPKNPAVLLLRRLEKWIYKKADAVVFTMEGGYEYIVEQNWQDQIPHSKIYTINNGVDLATFRENLHNYVLDCPELEDRDTFKVVYTGSIRKVNNLGLLLDAAKCVKNPRVRFLIWGAGDELETLRKRAEAEELHHVKFMGRVDKKYVPSIVSRADLNLAHNTPAPLFRFGISFNKLFDYLAAGKPVLSDFPCPYNPAVLFGAGTQVEEPTAENIARAIECYAQMPPQQYRAFEENACKAAQYYDYENLTRALLAVIEA